MGWFKKEKSLFEKIQAKVAPTPAQKRSKSLRNAVSTFKKELHKKTKPSAIDRVARRKKPENILTHAKALANATKTTADKHGKSVRKALFDESKHKTK